MIQITGWKSRGLWSKIGLSEDTHSSKVKASNIARLLTRDYTTTPCNIRGICMESWIEPVLTETEDAPKNEDIGTLTKRLSTPCSDTSCAVNKKGNCEGNLGSCY